MDMMDKIVIKFAKYAFKDILELLHYSGINEITITKEDNDLEIVIPSRKFESIKQDRGPVYSGTLVENKEWAVSGYEVEENKNV